MTPKPLKLSPRVRVIPISRRAVGHFERYVQDGSIEAKFIAFEAVPNVEPLWQQAWQVARERYGMIEGDPKRWRLISADLEA